MPKNGSEEKKWKVIRIFDEYRVLINIGANDGIEEGDLLRIVGEMEEIIDPETKKKLGTLEKVKAKVRATHVQVNMCVAESAESYKASIIPSVLSSLAPKEYLEKLPVDSESISGGWADEEIRIGDRVRKDIENTELYRNNLQNRILKVLYKEWLRVVGKGGIPEFDYDESAKQWNVPKEIMMRVIEETIDKGWLKHSTFGHVTLTPEGRKECERRKLDQ